MKKVTKLTFAFVLLLIIFLSSLYSAYSLNTDFGKVYTNAVKIDFEQGILTGLLYTPVNIQNQVYPAVIVAHGISESAQIMSNFGLELARNGFVALCLDLPGHGGSDESINQAQNNTALGVEKAVDYLSNLSYVNREKIGLIGHSIGAGAVRASNMQLKNVQASILIGGGISNSEQGIEYGDFNGSYPKNVLVIIGKYDPLFDIESLISRDLLDLFNTTDKIQPDFLYGDFQFQTSRKLLIPQTTHLFESLDTEAINESICWMQNALKIPSETQNNQIYIYKEVAQATALLSLIGLVLLAYNSTDFLLQQKTSKNQLRENSNSKQSKYHFVWIILNLVLIFPLIFLGFIIGFPPLVFGSSIAWWLFIMALIAIVLFYKTRLRGNFGRLSFRQILSINFDPKKLLLIVIFFLILLAVTFLLEFFGISLKLVAPIFQSFFSFRRVLVFFSFLPFFFPYFIIQQLYLLPNNFLDNKQKEYLKLIFINISPFLLLLALNYLPKVFFGIWIIPSFAGFIIEFLWLMTPIFALTTYCNIYFYNKTQNLLTGGLFNSLIFCWIAATVFPF